MVGRVSQSGAGIQFEIQGKTAPESAIDVIRYKKDRQAGFVVAGYGTDG